MQHKEDLESMQAELSRLSDSWNGEDGSPDIDNDPKYIEWLKGQASVEEIENLQEFDDKDTTELF